MEFFDKFGAEADSLTITPDGQRVNAVIEGVQTIAPVAHVDHRGRLYEVINPVRDPEFWVDPVIASYVFTIRENTLKGWGVHEHKEDRYCLISGETMTVLFDARFESPTYGVVQEVPLTPSGIRQLLIPAGVWHCSINVAPAETMLINFPTKPYRYDAPDRLTLPWHTHNIPVDISRYFPRQIGAMSVDDPC
jgi:dTDP-4-dehydrorhamnose 3,5-epimerase